MNSLKHIRKVEAAIDAAREFISNRKHQKAIDLLLKIRNEKLPKLPYQCQEKLEFDIQVCDLMASCHCELGQHEESIKLWKTDVIEAIKNLQYTAHPETPTLDDAYRYLEICYSSHLRYYDEALDVIEEATEMMASCNCNYAEPGTYMRMMAADCIDIWVYKGYVNAFTKYKNCNWIMDEPKKLNFLYFWSGKYKKAFEGQTTFDTLHSIYKKDEEKVHNYLTFTIFGLRKSGQSEKALKYLDFLNKYRCLYGHQTPISWMIHAVCALECGKPQMIIKFMEDCVDSLDSDDRSPDNFEYFDLLGFLTETFLETVDFNDPKRFLKYVQKDMRSPKGNQKIKKYRKGLEQYHNSMWIIMFTRQKLKRTVSECLLYVYRISVNQRFLGELKKLD